MDRKRIADTKEGQRYHLLDGIRGITLLSMIAYHGVWDLVYMYGVRWDWYRGKGAYIWQQSICWTFIFLSGFCWSMGKRPLKRGLVVFGSGLLVTAVTLIIMYQNRVVFGVLTFIGSAMLLMILLDRPVQRLEKQYGRLIPTVGIIISLIFFMLTRNINEGYLGFEEFRLMKLPVNLYRGMLMTYLGFPDPGFYSTDYFSLFPWLFLFTCGYFVYHLSKEKLSGYPILDLKIPVFGYIGKYSLLIYLLHQPVLYGLCGLLHFLALI